MLTLLLSARFVCWLFLFKTSQLQKFDAAEVLEFLLINENGDDSSDEKYCFFQMSCLLSDSAPIIWNF